MKSDFQFIDLMSRRWGGVAEARIHTSDLERIFDLAKQPADLRPQNMPPGFYTIEGDLLDGLLEAAREYVSATVRSSEDDAR